MIGLEDMHTTLIFRQPSMPFSEIAIQVVVFFRT